LLILLEPLIITPLAYLVFCLLFKLTGLWISFTIIQIILLIIGVFLLKKSFFKETKYKALLIDVDDTILDFIASEYYALEKAFNESGVEYNEESLNNYLKINTSYWHKFELKECSYDDIFNNRWIEFFSSINKEPVEGANDVYFKYLSTSSIILPNALKALKRLSYDYDIYYVTNGNNFVQHNRIYNTPIERFAKEVFISELIGYNKPEKKYFDYVLEHTGLKNDEVIVIGDSLSSDMLGAKNANMASIWINSKGKKSDWYTGFEAISLYDAQKIIRKLSNNRN
jgi:YjjG family noncanonical pyrimidine nucleotidase